MTQKILPDFPRWDRQPLISLKHFLSKQFGRENPCFRRGFKRKIELSLSRVGFGNTTQHRVGLWKATQDLMVQGDSCPWVFSLQQTTGTSWMAICHGCWASVISFVPKILGTTNTSAFCHQAVVWYSRKIKDLQTPCSTPRPWHLSS